MQLKIIIQRAATSNLSALRKKFLNLKTLLKKTTATLTRSGKTVVMTKKWLMRPTLKKDLKSLRFGTTRRSLFKMAKNWSTTGRLTKCFTGQTLSGHASQSTFCCVNGLMLTAHLTQSLGFPITSMVIFLSQR